MKKLEIISKSAHSSRCALNEADANQIIEVKSLAKMSTYAKWLNASTV